MPQEAACVRIPLGNFDDRNLVTLLATLDNFNQSPSIENKLRICILIQVHLRLIVNFYLNL